MSENHLPTNELPPIEHPPYYTISNIEVWDAIIAWGLDFCDGNVVKYVARASYHTAGRITNLYKAHQYILKAIEVEEAKCAHEKNTVSCSQSISKPSDR